MAGLLCNVGPVERIVRLAVAGLGAVPLVSGRQPPNLRKWLAIVSAAEVLTAFTRFCPANLLMGVNHCRRGLLGSVAHAAASVVPGGPLASDAVAMMGSAGGAVTKAAGKAAGAASDAGSSALSGAASAMSSLGSEDEDDDDDDRSGDNLSLLVTGAAALAVAAGFAFAINATRVAHQAAARSSRSVGGRQPAVESLAPTLQSALDSPTGEATNTPA